MKIVIPMAGSGTRFSSAGYIGLKPLLRVDGNPIIEHLVNIFPGEENFVFVCNIEHLATTPLQEILLNLRPKAKIIGISPHKKGPVYTLVQAFHEIDDKEPIIVSYCDFAMRWNYLGFKERVKKLDCEGALPAYTGFHPNLLPQKNVYASIKVDSEGYMEEIREKYSFASDKTQSLHSPGIFYFKKGKDLKKYSEKLLNDGIVVNGEYYVSLIYNLFPADNKRVYVYAEISHFLQWGTPEDLEEYEAWSRFFAKKTEREKGITDISASREHLVRIPYVPGSPEYDKSYAYWEQYFATYKF